MTKILVIQLCRLGDILMTGPLLRGLRCPTLLLNTEHDSLAFADAPSLALLPHGERQVIASPARKPHWEDAEAYAAAVAGFVLR